MEVIQIETNKLVLDSRFQTKNEDVFMINKLRVSIQRHGQISLVHVIPGPDGDHLIISGSRIVKILKELMIPNTYCLLHKNYQDALMVALELDSIRFSIDYFKVAEQVDELNKLGVTNQRLQHSVSWSKDELDNMLKMHKFDWEKFGEPDEDVNQISLF